MSFLTSIAKKRPSIIAFKACLFLLLILGSVQTAHAYTDYERYGFNGTWIYQTSLTGNPSNFQVEVVKYTTCCYSSYPPDIRFGSSTDSGSSYVAISGNDWGNNVFSSGGSVATTTYYFTYSGGGYDLNRYVNGGFDSYERYDDIALEPYVYLRNTYPPNDNGDYGDGTGDSYFVNFRYTGESEPVNTATRIIDFNPQNNSTTTGPVIDFDLHAYINPDDLGTIRGIKITLHNIDQNVLLLGALSPSDIYLFEGNATTSGDFYFATSTTLGDGNYRLEACLERSYFGGWIINPFANVILGQPDCQSHQFIVGEATFIGNISQAMFTQTNDFFNGLSATSSEALASTCNPLSGNFGIRECTAFLFVPDGNTLKTTMENARVGIFSRVPWGYVTRVVTMIQNPATSTLPAWTNTISVGPGSDDTPETTTISFDMADTIAGAGALLDSIEDPHHGQSVRDVFEPLVKLAVALAVLLTIVADVTRSHGHSGESRPATKLS